LKKILKEMQSVLLAYSGGTDSSFLLKVAWDSLGNNDLRFIINTSNVTYKKDYRPGTRAKKELGIRPLLEEAGFSKSEMRQQVPGMR